MRLNKLVLLDFPEDYFDLSYFNRLSSLANEVCFVSEKNVDKRDELIKDADGILLRYFTPFQSNSIDRLEYLKYVGVSSSSLSMVDVEVLDQKGIVLGDVKGYCDVAVAEFVFAALLSRLRYLSEAIDHVSSGDFFVHPAYEGFELAGKKFGILGLGHIGKKVAHIASGFDMHVQYYSRHEKDVDSEFYCVDLDTLFSTSDFLGVFIDSNPSTFQLLDYDLLNMLKDQAFIISVSHTDVFDFSALMEVLDSKNVTMIQTYFETIPFDFRDKLLACKNAVVYPSIAVQTKETKMRLQKMIVDNLEDFLSNSSNPS